jgi:hypothetical protein
VWGGGAGGAGGDKRRGPRLLLLVVFLAVAGLIAAFGYGRLPGTVPAPAFPADAPPAGVNVVYARDPNNAHGLIAYDWSGARRGVVRFPTWVDISRLRPAPDGNGFLLDPAMLGDYAAYFDRGGRTIYETDDASFVSQAWADDSIHVCVLANFGGGAALITRTPGLPDRAVRATLIATDYAVIACSLRSDSLILGSGNGVRTVDLSSGSMFGGMGDSAGWAASVDAAYFAAYWGGLDIVGIWKVSDFRNPQVGAPLARLDPNLQPIAFSGDDSLLVAGSGGSLVAIEWRTGRTAWTYSLNGKGIDLFQPRPGGGDFVISSGGATTLIRRDGSTLKVG